MSTSDFRPAADVVEEALAAGPGGDDRIVVVEDADEVELRFAANTTTTNGSRRTRRVTVVAVHWSGDGRAGVGVARRSGDVDCDELASAAEREAASASPAGDAAPLLTPDEAWAPGSADRAFDDPPGQGDLSMLSDVLAGLSAALGRARSGSSVLAGFAEHRLTTTTLGTSTGVRLAHAQPEGSLQMVDRDRDGGASAWVGSATRDFTDLSVEALEDQLARRRSWAETRIERPAGRYEVLLPPSAVADLMIGLAYGSGGQDAEDGRSAFSRAGGGTRVGERLATLPFDLRTDPAEPGLECAPFVVATASSADESVFDNGLPSARTHWIADGRLARLRYHRAGAARAGVEPAAGPDNLILEVPGADATLEEMIAGTERGLLLTCLWYLREVDPATMLLTGLTRDGVYAVEDGVVVGAVNNFRFNESPVDLLARATGVGASVGALGREFGEYLSRTRMPPVRIPDFNMSSVSPAT